MRPRLAPALGPTLIPFLLGFAFLGDYIYMAVSDDANPRIAVTRIIALVVLAIVSLAFYLLWEKEKGRVRRLNERHRPRYAPDLAANEIEEWDVTILDAVEVWDPAGECPSFFLELEDGRALFLEGPYLVEDVKARRFPNRSLHITRLPHAGDTHALECRGAYLAPSYRRGMFEPEEYQADTAPRDGQILPGPLATYKTRPVEEE